jgi:hypothetical protein
LFRSTRLQVVLALLAVALGAAAAALGCGSGAAGAGFGSSDGSTSSAAPGVMDAGQSDDAPAIPLVDGAPLVLGPSFQNDAASGNVSICSAGVYQGTFTTYVGTGGDGGSPGLFSAMWDGNLSIDLAAKRVVVTSGSGNGESFSTDTSRLDIAEGGALDGGDTMGGTFFADLNGELNCDPDAGPPFHLSATLSNGSYRQSFFSLSIGGSLSADYQASTPPMLANGQILVYGVLTEGGAPFASASGTWSATWVSQ